MLKRLVAILSIPLVIAHVVILYLWISYWEVLVTRIGLIGWGGSIFLGIIIFVMYSKVKAIDKRSSVIRATVLASTLMSILLGLLSVLITLITSSMP
ncbi:MULTISPECIES: hypothetical protein [Gracilibacillus]|uniref:hypothetical protein n=1 Tax=Gracilibacillus TaxID=74385 RepID=UPI000824BC5F|nr:MULTISPECIES: hypothetical protein [Gracilibacillus]